MPGGVELAAGAPEEVEFQDGTLEGRPEDGIPKLGELEDSGADDSGPDAEVLEDDNGPVVKGTEGEELDGKASEDVEFQRPLEDGEPDGGRPDAGYVRDGMFEDGGTDSGALALALALDEGSLEEAVPTSDELDGITPGDVEFQRPLEDGRPEEGRPEDGRFEGGYSEDPEPVTEGLESAVVDEARPVVRGTEAGEVDSDPEKVLDSELPEDAGPVVNGIEKEELGLPLSDDETFNDGPLEEGRPEGGRLDKDDDGFVCLEKDEDDGVWDNIEDCG